MYECGGEREGREGGERRKGEDIARKENNAHGKTLACVEGGRGGKGKKQERKTCHAILANLRDYI